MTRIHSSALGLALAATLALGLARTADAQVKHFPAGFVTEDVALPGVTLHARVGGSGPAVVLLHGFGDTGDMWAPLATELAKTHRVVVPDLPGMGLSSLREGGYQKRDEAGDIRALLEHYGIDTADVVGHDIGTMVAYAYARRYPDKTTKLVVMDAPVPGVPPWDDIVRSPKLWQFDFGGPDMVRLVKDRERIYLDRFWNEFAGDDPSKIDELSRQHYARIYARPGKMKAAFAQFNAFRQDAVVNAASLTTPLPMPVLAIGGEKSFGENEAIVMRNAASNVTGLVVPGSGHWLMEEATAPTVDAIVSFLK